MERTIIFCNTKYLCDRLEGSLTNEGWGVLAIHGDKTQADRDYALNCFKSGQCEFHYPFFFLNLLIHTYNLGPILVATDVAARGLDVKELKHVINYDFPNNVEDYVHRVGRTGRGGETGFAYTFFDAKVDKRSAGDLVQLLRDAGQVVDPNLQALVKYPSAGGRGGGRGGFNRWGGGGRGGGGGYGGGRGRGGFGGGRGGWR
jgi:ATP-dependent RNA helicase DDX5/DBP2